MAGTDLENQIDVLASAIQAGDARALARGVTLVENRTPVGRELVRRLYPLTGRAVTTGITGPAGVGKSTLVNGLIRAARAQSCRVGVIAVDPSSPFSRGAVLGDRVRMLEHHADQDVFIRSMATRGSLGGVAEATLEIAFLLDAAGFDLIFIETVGVGQDEIEICSLADVTVVVLVPGLGDDVQTLKAGLMEVAGIFAVNKSDLPGAEKVEQEIQAMQSLSVNPAKPLAPVHRVIAADGTGIQEILRSIRDVASRRVAQCDNVTVWEYRLQSMLARRMFSLIDPHLPQFASLVATRAVDPLTVVDRIWEECVVRTKKADVHDT